MFLQSAPEGAELRLALGMRGGVSLAVWIGGACAEIDELRQAVEDQEGFWWEVLQRSHYSKVVVDVMAGASAGGLNGVLFAGAIRHGFRMRDLLNIWRRVADVDKLRRREAPWLSMFDGDSQFLDVIRAELEGLTAGRHAEGTDYIDLQLSATLVEPLGQAAISPGDEKLRRTRSSARFHFRHDPGAAVPRRDLELSELERMAVAARATASFPMAFEAAIVRSSRPDRFQGRRSTTPAAGAPRPAPPMERTAARLIDCHGVFSESRGPAARPNAMVDDDFVVADGGIVDNIPLSKALDAIRDAPAARPTRRVLVYLHPTGPSGLAGRPRAARAGESDEERQLRRRGPVTMASGLVASRIQGESIEGDLERLEAHNRRVRLAALLRRAALDDLLAGPAGRARRPLQVARQRRLPYLVQRAGADAEAIRQLLSDPLAALGEDPFPLAPAGESDDRWRSPIAGWSSAQRLDLDVKLRERFTNRLGSRALGIDLLVGGLGPLSRTLASILELVREGEKQEGMSADLSLEKPALYRLASLASQLDRVRQLGWVAAAGRLGNGDVAAWASDTLDHLNDLLHCEPAVADALSRPDEETTFAAAAEAYFDRCAELLQGIADGSPRVPRSPASVDLRKRLVASLEPVVDRVLTALRPPPDGPVTVDAPRSGAEVIQRALLDDAPFAMRLATVEVLLLEEHLLGVGGATEVGFARMSAAAPTIGAERFARLHPHSQALNPDFTADGHHLVPDVKLAGNELASFSAFLDERWRVNDWTWGRMDAVSTLVELLLGEDRPPADRPAPSMFANLPSDEAWARARVGGDAEGTLKRALIAERQEQIFRSATEDGVLPLDPAQWVAGLETLVAKGSPRLADSVGEVASVAALVVGGVLPASIPRISGQLTGVARRVGRRFAKPTGVLPSLPMDPSGPPPPSTTMASGGAKGILTAAAAALGALVAATVWAAVQSPPSLAIGALVGLTVAFVPSALLLWLATLRRPTPGDPPGGLVGVLATGLVIGALVTIGVRTLVDRGWTWPPW